MKFGLGPSTEKNGIPRIESVAPAAAIPGGEVEIRGTGFATRTHLRPQVRFGDVEATLARASPQRLVARVPEGANGGVVRVVASDHESQPFPIAVGMQIADNLHPVASPAVDMDGNIFVTFSGSRGQRVPVSLYKITANFSVKPFVTSLTNPSGLAVDRAGNLFVSCRNDGTIHRVSGDGRSEQWIEGMGVAAGLASDRDGNLFVAASLGGRRGIIRINPNGRAELALSGSGVVGMALLPSGRAIVTTSSAVFTLDWEVRGLPLLG